MFFIAAILASHLPIRSLRTHLWPYTHPYVLLKLVREYVYDSCFTFKRLPIYLLSEHIASQTGHRYRKTMTSLE